MTWAGDGCDALVCEPLPRDSKLPQLVPDHVLRHRHRDVVFAIMDQEPDPSVYVAM